MVLAAGSENSVDDCVGCIKKPGFCLKLDMFGTWLGRRGMSARNFQFNNRRQ